VTKAGQGLDTNIIEKKGGIITLKNMIWTDKAILWLKFSYLEAVSVHSRRSWLRPNFFRFIFDIYCQLRW
jgi:hypothetical protein